MSTILLIDVRDGSGWLARDGAGTPWRAGQAMPADTRVVAVAPAEAVGLHRIALPARRLSELRQAVPFALEERLAEPVESLQFALGGRAGDQVEVAVVARRQLQAWIDALAERGLVADALVADAHLLPRDDQILHVARIGERVLVSGPEGAQAMPLADWPRWRALLPALPLRLLDPEGRWIDGDQPVALDRTSFLRLAGVGADAAPDLLQGEFAPRRRTAGRQRLWRWAAMLAVATIALALIEAGVGVLVEQGRRADLLEQQTTLFRQTLPEARLTADPAAQFAAELRRRPHSGDAVGVFALLAVVAPSISQGSRYRLEALDYRLGTLELEIAAADVAALDALRETLVTQGVQVELTGVNPTGDGGVRGRLRLRGAQA